MADTCTVKRTMLITGGTLNIATGESATGAQHWETRACGTPLFTDAERKSGQCRSCASGWTHPHNYRAETA